jgi:hypothetical protein
MKEPPEFKLVLDYIMIVVCIFVYGRFLMRIYIRKDIVKMWWISLMMLVMIIYWGTVTIVETIKYNHKTTQHVQRTDYSPSEELYYLGGTFTYQ